jgi:hypothetical protein
MSFLYRTTSLFTVYGVIHLKDTGGSTDELVQGQDNIQLKL